MTETGLHLHFRNLFLRAEVLWKKYNPLPENTVEMPFLKKPETWIYIVYCLLTFLMVFFHEPWRDEAQGYLIVRELSFSGLFDQLRLEMHFPLWYLLLFPFVKAGMPVLGAQLLQWGLASALAGVILYKAPFRILTRLLLIFSFPVFFEFNVIARNYTVGFLLFSLILVFWKDRKEHPLRIAFLMAGGLLSDIFFWGLIAGLFLIVFIEAVGEKRFCRRVFLSFAGILFAAGLADVLILLHGASGIGNGHLITRSLSNVGGTVLPRLINPFCLMSRFSGLPLWLFLLLTFLLIRKIRKKRDAWILFLSNSLYILLLFAAGNFNNVRHFSFFYAGAAASLWLASVYSHPENAAENLTERTKEKILNRIFGGLAAWSLLYSVGMSANAFYREILYDYSHGKYAADFLRKQDPRIPLFCGDIAYYTPILAYLPNGKFFELAENKFASFSSGGKVQNFSKEKISSLVVRNLPPEADCGLYAAMVYDLPTKREDNVFLLYSSMDSESKIWGHPEEYYWIFLIVRPEKKHLFLNQYSPFEPFKFK